MNQPFHLQVVNDDDPTQHAVLTDNPAQQIVEFDGFYMPDSTLLSVNAYNYDGAIYQDSILNPRGMTLTIYFTSKSFFDSVKHAYQLLFASGTTVRIGYGTNNNTYFRWINAVVESVSLPRFNQPRKAYLAMQINLVAFNPLWVSGSKVIQQAFTNTFTINYDGSYPAPFAVTISNGATITDPVIHCNGETLSLNLSTTQKIMVDTGNKKIEVGNANYITAWVHGSKWLKLKHGTNTITFSATVSATRATKITYEECYLGAI